MATSSTSTPERTLLLRLIEQGYDHRAWHGTNLRGSIRGVPAEQVVWRSGPGRRNIAEIVVHCAYWKYAVRRRICGDKRGSFPLKGSNWFKIPARPAEREWREYIALLESQHRALREAVATVPWSRLAAGPGGSGKNPASHVFGAAMHDVYHAGQIQTLKALYKAKKRAYS